MHHLPSGCRLLHKGKAIQKHFAIMYKLRILVELAKINDHAAGTGDGLGSVVGRGAQITRR
jgi:hypothetical protein